MHHCHLTSKSCLGYLSQQQVSQDVCQQAQGWERIWINVATEGVLVVYREADAEVIGHDASVFWEGHDSTSAASLSLDRRGAAYTAIWQKEWHSFLHLYSRCTKIKETFRTFLMKSAHPNNKSTFFDQLSACPAKRSHTFKMLWSIANMCVEALIFMHFDKTTNHLSTISLSHGEKLRVL